MSEKYILRFLLEKSYLNCFWSGSLDDRITWERYYNEIKDYVGTPSFLGYGKFSWTDNSDSEYKKMFIRECH